MKIFYFIINPKKQYIAITTQIITLYCIIPFFIFLITNDNIYIDCAAMAIISSIMICIGAIYTNKKYPQKKHAFQTHPVSNITLILLALFFISFLSYTIYSASSIPLIVSIMGGSIDEISSSRALFLKGREGFESILVYINSLLSSFIIPYILIKLYHSQSRFFKYFLLIFSTYSIISTEKAFFIRWALPLTSLFYLISISENPSYKRKIKIVLILSLFIIFSNIIFSGISGEDGFEKIDIIDFFSATYSKEILNKNSLVFFIWRTLSVPIFTAIDSLKTFNKVFFGNIFFGATNGTLSNILNIERIWFERDVFAYQWGQNESGTMSSNAVYFIEAYVNYGWPGIVLFSFYIGKLLASMGKSNDIGYCTLAPLVTYNLIYSGLLGTILSNGLLFLIALNAYKNNKNVSAYQQISV